MQLEGLLGVLDKTFNGARRDFDPKKEQFLWPSGVVNTRYPTAAMAVSEASENKWSSILVTLRQKPI